MRLQRLHVACKYNSLSSLLARLYLQAKATCFLTCFYDDCFFDGCPEN